MAIDQTKLQKLYAKVEPFWLDALKSFIKTNQLTDDFAKHLDECPRCQAVVDYVMDVEEEALHAVGNWLDKSRRSGGESAHAAQRPLKPVVCLPVSSPAETATTAAPAASRVAQASNPVSISYSSTQETPRAANAVS